MPEVLQAAVIWWGLGLIALGVLVLVFTAGWWAGGGRMTMRNLWTAAILAFALALLTLTVAEDAYRDAWGAAWPETVQTKPLPWRTVGDARQYQTGEEHWSCNSGRHVIGTEYQKDGQGYYLAASRGRWALWEYNVSGSETLYVWYGQRTLNDGGVLVPIESGLLKAMSAKYPGPCAWFDLVPMDPGVPGFVPPEVEPLRPRAEA